MLARDTSGSLHDDRCEGHDREELILPMSVVGAGRMAAGEQVGVAVQGFHVGVVEMMVRGEGDVRCGASDLGTRLK